MEGVETFHYFWLRPLDTMALKTIPVMEGVETKLESFVTVGWALDSEDYPRYGGG